MRMRNCEIFYADLHYNNNYNRLAPRSTLNQIDSLKRYEITFILSHNAVHPAHPRPVTQVF